MDLTKTLLSFQPERVWRTYPGGATLDKMEGQPNPKDDHWPEDWVGSTTEAVNPVERPAGEGLARIAEGEQPLFRDLLSTAPEALLGAEHVEAYGAKLPLLVKLLDSAIRLHFQAHPTAEFARAHQLGPSGKAEGYHILSVRPEIKDPYIYLGFQRPPSREEFRRIIEEQDISALEACFDRIPVKVGETYFIPGGRPHAIGPGILMVEVMEPSDLAVRFEFERGGYVLPESARFMQRGLDFCLDVFDYSPLPLERAFSDYRCEPKRRQKWSGDGEQYSLIENTRNPRFTVRKSVFKSPSKWEGPEAFIGIVTQGCGVLSDGQRSLEVKPYDRFFCPAALEQFNVSPKGEELTILECYPPLPSDAL
jgi:mannose-6-phosphate isomerase